MANQPRLRPWSRLASLRSVSDPAPPESQNQKLINSPPPPPPSKLNVNNEIKHKIPVEQEPKTMLVNKTTTEKPIGNGNGNSLQKVLNNKKLSDDSEESGIRMITIAGENKGAYMQIIQTRKKPNHVNSMANNSEMKKDENANRKEKSEKVIKTTLSSPPRNGHGVYINSNVQCVNNSLLLHTSCTHNDPGVHLMTHSNKPLGEGYFHLKERVDGQRN